MNDYVRELSQQLNTHRAQFLKTRSLLEQYTRLLPPREKWQCVDERQDAWVLYSGSAEFAKTLAACKAAACRVVPWMLPADRQRPESPEARSAAFGSAHRDADRLSVIPYYSSVTYKPYAPFIRTDYSADMEAYARLGARLARTHRDYLPSEWIHAQANSPDYE